jgi:hypothetical protein
MLRDILYSAFQSKKDFSMRKFYVTLERLDILPHDSPNWKFWLALIKKYS